MDRYLEGVGDRNKLPFPDDFSVTNTQSTAVIEKRKHQELDHGSKRQRRSPQLDRNSQHNLPLFNVTKNVAPSSESAAKDNRPFPEESICNLAEQDCPSTTASTSPTNLTLGSSTNAPVTTSQGHGPPSQGGGCQEYLALNNGFSQSQTLLSEAVADPNLEHTQETLQTQDTLVDPVPIKRENEGSNWHISGPGHASWDKQADKIDYFEDDETLHFDDWLNLPSDKAIKEETYSVGSSDEEDMVHLADAVASTIKHTPPTSVLKEMDASSSIEIFDPKLQHSPPIPSSDLGSTKPKQVDTEEVLLDSDVDWDSIMLQLPVIPQNPSLSPQLPIHSLPIKAKPKDEPPRPLSLPKPFARPPFPTPLRDKSPITGISRAMVFRTCFRAGHFIAEGNRCDRQKQDAIFELFARVTFSSRENGQRVQHFQFADMFKDQQPYPSGILNGWKTGSLLEKHSAAFLQIGSNNGEAKMCRCICRLKREKKNELGWVVDILSIEEANWDDVQVVRGVVCRE
ncbi:hypothetical protein QBC43DRAFT_304108 [Cladorrhinum sp. PSN259]|nr:hypothetical protein QBC43DRAFT_304108 [Cladorrhinum sp. PSN259]